MVMDTKSKVAVIGLGNIGTILATNLVKGNRAVIIADRNVTKANELAEKLGNLVQPGEIVTTIQQADIIILAVWFDTIKEFFNTYAAAFNNKIIVDLSNPIAPDDKGGFKKIIANQDSAGQILAGLLPKGAKLAKALGSLGAGSLSDAAFGKPEKAVLFYATDDTTINNEIEELILDNGFDPVRMGGIDQSIRIEVFGDLHEFGALGKTITLNEAKKLIV
jgi:predicted dinucleotide-binding enzyme